MLITSARACRRLGSLQSRARFVEICDWGRVKVSVSSIMSNLIVICHRQWKDFYLLTTARVNLPP